MVPYLEVVYDLLRCLHNIFIALGLQPADEGVFPQAGAQRALVVRNTPRGVFLAEILIHAQKGIQRHEEGGVASGNPIINNHFTVDHPATSPALEALAITEPDGLVHSDLGHALIPDSEEIAQLMADIVHIVQACFFIVLVMGDIGTDHLCIDGSALMIHCQLLKLYR